MSTFSNENHVTRGFTSDAINEFAQSRDFRFIFDEK
jgi:TolB-like protein